MRLSHPAAPPGRCHCGWIASWGSSACPVRARVRSSRGCQSCAAQNLFYFDTQCSEPCLLCVSLVSNRYGVQRAEQMPGLSFSDLYAPEIGRNSHFFLGLCPHEGLSVLLKCGCECPLQDCQAYSAFLLGAENEKKKLGRQCTITDSST